MGLLDGRRCLVAGVANKRSLAWGCTSAFLREGAEVILTYQNDHFKNTIERLLDENGYRQAVALYHLDVTDEDSLAELGRAIGGHGKLDVIVHSIAHARTEDLEGSFLQVSRQGFGFALDVSAYSLVSLTRALRPHLSDDASVITMTYHAGERVVPNYNVMAVAKQALETIVRYLAAELGPAGVRVNAVSAGAVKTLAASGVKGISHSIKTYEEIAPLRRAVTIEEIGDAAVFLASRLSRAVTGTILFVDEGFHVLGSVPTSAS